MRRGWVLALAVALAGCCPLVPDDLACSHCTCGADPRSVSRPVACATMGREPTCCPPIVFPTSAILPTPPS